MTNIVPFIARPQRENSDLAAQYGDLLGRAVRELSCATFMLETAARRLDATSQATSAAQPDLVVSVAAIGRLIDVLQTEIKALKARVSAQ